MSGGALYGTAQQGGVPGVGTIFRVNPDGALTNLYSFTPLTYISGVPPYNNGRRPSR